MTEQQTTVRSDSAHLLMEQNLDYLPWIFLTVLKFQKLSRVMILGSEGHSWTFPPVLWSLSSCFWTQMGSSSSLLPQGWSRSQCLWLPLVMLLFCIWLSQPFLFLIFIKKFLYIYLYIPGLCCSKWALFFNTYFYLFTCLAVLSVSCVLWYLIPWPGIKPRCSALGVWSLSHWTTREVPAGELVVVACGISFTDQGLNLGPLHCESRVLAIGPPEKSLPLPLKVSSLDTQARSIPHCLDLHRDYGSQSIWGADRKTRFKIFTQGSLQVRTSQKLSSSCCCCCCC